MRNYLLILIVLTCFNSLGQGRNNTWLLGNSSGFTKARIIFDSSSYNIIIPDNRQMTFRGTQATISDENGNFLMSSNGVWIENANNDTMMNGSGLNPGPFTGSWPNGLTISYANIFLPFPGDSEKYILFHHTATFNGSYYPANEIFYSIIDLTGDSGLGEVISKNNIVLSDTLNWGLAACKHANGRDWWIVAQKDTSNIIFKFLLTPTGISNISSQQLNVPIAWGNVTQLTFSPDGNKFAYTTYVPFNYDSCYVLLFDFDRCSGDFYNENIIFLDKGPLWGVAFSTTSNFVYSNSSNEIFQINTSTLSVDTVALYDNFCYPNPPWCTDFRFMYLAANGKIYITSGNGVQHIHEMNYPNLAGLACDVQQHKIFLNTWYLRSVPNHPNYYLGAVTGSACDSLTRVTEIDHDFKFSVFPNPSNGEFSIMYLLPQNKGGLVEVFDIKGRIVYSYNLPQWSTLQYISLPSHLSNGLYICIITSDGQRVSRKIAISH